MTYNSNEGGNMSHHSRFNRGSHRIPGYDYTQPGAYFITICSYHRMHIFGQIKEGTFMPSPAGQIVEEEWFRSEQIREEIKMDAFVLMPNHLHGIVWITKEFQKSEGAHGHAILWMEPRSIGSFVAGFKSVATCRINQISNSPGDPVWQHNYHEWVIRSPKHLDHVRRYILQNPGQWEDER
jgi:putative transposase